MPWGLKRYQDTGDLHFITFSCYKRQPFLSTPGPCRVFEQTLEDVRRWYGLYVTGYVVMPEHVHLLVSEPEHGNLAEAMHYLKLSFSKRGKSLTGTQVNVQTKDANPSAGSGEVPSASSGQALGNHAIPTQAIATQVSVQRKDANLGHQRIDANLGHQQSNEPFWQKRYYDRNVRSVREFGIKLRYLHRNPVKRGLVRDPGDWKWSSFRHYAFREMGVVEIESEWTGRDRELKATGGPPRVFLCPG